MTMVKPTIQESAGVHMRVVRMAFSAFLDGPGLAQATDFLVSGDPSALALNIAPGVAFLEMPNDRNGYEPLISDGVETRSLGTAPNSGTRTDLVYLGIKDQEFGDLNNDWEIFVKTNPSVGTGTPPAPDLMAATYKLAEVDVPAKVTRGSQCVIRRAGGTTAPVRDGGYQPGDLVLPSLPVFTKKDTITSFGSAGSATRAHGAPFRPRSIIVQINGVPLSRTTAVAAIVQDQTINATTFTWNLTLPGGWWPSGATGPVFASYHCFP